MSWTDARTTRSLPILAFCVLNGARKPIVFIEIERYGTELTVLWSIRRYCFLLSYSTNKRLLLCEKTPIKLYDKKMALVIRMYISQF